MPAYVNNIFKLNRDSALLILTITFLFPGTASGRDPKSPIEELLHLFDEILVAARTANFSGLDDAGGRLPVLIFSEELLPVFHSFSQEIVPRENLILCSCYMIFRTAPTVILWGLNDSGPYGIHLHISDCRIKVPLIQDTGKKPALPEVTVRILLAVEILGILHVHRIESPGQRFLMAGNTNKMDMIRHEAIGPYFEAIFGSKSGEQLNISGIIAFFGEYGLPVISPLRDVVGITNRNGSG
jgi:hypothetical protein